MRGQHLRSARFPLDHPNGQPIPHSLAPPPPPRKKNPQKRTSYCANPTPAGCPKLPQQLHCVVLTLRAVHRVGGCQALFIPPPHLVLATQKSQINTVPTPTVAWTRA